ncbi:MAG TPA: hypothetical protein VGN54_03960 [Mycobacteriales bacterium]|jgi:hypothetical protein|nr:hypothetical protein [Mycobacteriales bacterium]
MSSKNKGGREVRKPKQEKKTTTTEPTAVVSSALKRPGAKAAH